MESCPPITWTESGQTPVLKASSSSRLRRSSLAGRRQRVGESPVDVIECFEIEWLGATVVPLGWVESPGRDGLRV